MGQRYPWLVQQNLCQWLLMGLLLKQKMDLKLHNTVWMPKTRLWGKNGIICHEKAEVSHDEGGGSASMFASGRIQWNSGDFIMTCNRLTVFVTATACKQAQVHPVKYCHKQGEQISGVLLNQIADLSVKHFQHLVGIGFLFWLQGAPFECLHNDITKGGKIFCIMGLTT